MRGAEAEVAAEIGDIGDIRTTNAVVSATVEGDTAIENETANEPTKDGIEATVHIPGSASTAAVWSERGKTEVAAPKQGEKEAAVLPERKRGAIDPGVEALRRHDATGERIESGIGIGEVQGQNIELLRVGEVGLLIRARGRVDEGLGTGGDRWFWRGICPLCIAKGLGEKEAVCSHYAVIKMITILTYRLRTPRIKPLSSKIYFEVCLYEPCHLHLQMLILFH
jgi:hypothetical protein